MSRKYGIKLIASLAASLMLLSAACGGDDEPNTNLGDEPAKGSSDIGNQCEGNSDCSANTCLFKVDGEGNYPDYGYCSGTCESFSDCPSFWDCSNVGNASAKYCVQGS